jgi:hypothetical protein
VLKAIASAIFTLALLAAAPTRVADPMKFMGYLIGTWSCTSGSGAQMQRYTARYAYANGGTWLRTINSSKQFSSEDMMTYTNHRWVVIDMEPTRLWSVLSAPDKGAAHIPLQTEYPKPGLNVTFDRISTRKYTLTFGGRMNGKPAKWTDTCTKT